MKIKRGLIPEPSRTITTLTPSFTFSRGNCGSARPIIINVTETKIRTNGKCCRNVKLPLIDFFTLVSVLNFNAVDFLDSVYFL